MKQPFHCDLHSWIQLYTVGQVWAQTREDRQGSPHRRHQPLGARKHKGSCGFQRPNITLTQQFHCDRPSLPCKSQKGCVNQDRRHKHEAAITVRSAPLNSTLHCRTGLSANAWRQTRFPTSTPGATWCENIGFRAMSSAQTSPGLLSHISALSTSLLSPHLYFFKTFFENIIKSICNTARHHVKKTQVLSPTAWKLLRCIQSIIHIQACNGAAQW